MKKMIIALVVLFAACEPEVTYHPIERTILILESKLLENGVEKPLSSIFFVHRLPQGVTAIEQEFPKEGYAKGSDGKDHPNTYNQIEEDGRYLIFDIPQGNYVIFIKAYGKDAWTMKQIYVQEKKHTELKKVFTTTGGGKVDW